MPAHGAAGPALPKARLYPPECASHMCPLIPTASNGLAVHAPLHECSLHRVNGRNVSAPSTKYATVCLRVWGDSECLASEQRKQNDAARPRRRGEEEGAPGLRGGSERDTTSPRPPLARYAKKNRLYSDVFDFVRCGCVCACLHGVWDSPARGALGSMSRVAWHAFSFSSILVLYPSRHELT
jgi:hypothetical protein